MNEPFIFQTLPERIKALFPEIDSDTAIDLLHNNDEYGQLHQRKGELTEQYPFISAVLEGEGPIALSAEEHKILTDYLDTATRMEDMERMQLYFRGHTDGFSYLKKIGAI
jgi:hypothetical protein